MHDKSFHITEHNKFLSALEENNIPEVKSLLSRNNSLLNSTNDEGVLIVYLAIPKMKKEMVEELFKQEFDFSQRTPEGASSVHYLALANVKEKEDEIEEIFDFLVDKQHLNIECIMTDDDETFLHWCAKNNNDQLIRHLMNKYSGMINEISANCDGIFSVFSQINSKGETIFHIAIKRGYLPIVKLIENNARPLSFFDSKGEELLKLASESKKNDIYNYLLPHVLKLGNSERHEPSHFHLRSALQNNNIEAIKILYKRDPLILGTLDNDKDRVPMVYSALPTMTVETLEYLLDNNFDYSMLTARGMTIFHYAALSNIEIIDRIILFNEKKKGDPLFSLPCIENIIEYTTKVNKKDEAPIDWARDHSKKDIVKHLTGLLNPNIKDNIQSLLSSCSEDNTNSIGSEEWDTVFSLDPKGYINSEKSETVKDEVNISPTSSQEKSNNVVQSNIPSSQIIGKPDIISEVAANLEVDQAKKLKQEDKKSTVFRRPKFFDNWCKKLGIYEKNKIDLPEKTTTALGGRYGIIFGEEEIDIQRVSPELRNVRPERSKIDVLEL